MAEGRRLPVYLLLDTSGSMMGEPIEAVRQGLRALVADLRGDPQAPRDSLPLRHHVQQQRPAGLPAHGAARLSGTGARRCGAYLAGRSSHVARGLP